MKSKTLGLLFFSCCLISIIGVLYNIVTNYSGIIILHNFFRDGEDMHLGTLLLIIGPVCAIILFVVSRRIKISPNYSREIEDAFNEQKSKRTLPKDTSKQQSKPEVEQE